MSDTDFPFDPDDPRVTAYALDEMQDAGARAEFEQLLARSPEARAMVEEIRALSGQLIAEYDEERLLAQGEPSNVIPLAAPAMGAWSGQILRMAAALAVLGIAGALLAPYIRGPKAVQLEPEADINLGRDVGAVPAAAKRPALVPQAVEGLRQPATVVARGGVASQIALPFGALNAPAPSFTLSINGNVDQTAAVKAAARPVAATDAKDENVMSAAPRAGEDSDVILKPSSEKPIESAAAAPATVAGNALGGGAGSALTDAPANAKDAFFQNRFLGSADGNGADSSASGQVFAQSSVASLKRLAPASRAHALEAQATQDESGFVSTAQAPLSHFDIALNTDNEAKLTTASATREMARAPVAGKTPGKPDDLAIQVESASCPWAPDHRLVRIGFQGRAGANDARQVQVKFDPAQVAEYRLVGGAPRTLPLDAWQEASVLYEVVPAKAPQVEDKAKELDRLPTDSQAARLRMVRPSGPLTVAVQQSAALKAGVSSDSRSEEFAPVEVPAAPGDISSASVDFKFAAAVAAYDLHHLDLAIQLAQEGLGPDPGGYRAAFLNALRKQAQEGR